MAKDTQGAEEYEFKEDDDANYQQAYPLKRSFKRSGFMTQLKKRKKVIMLVIFFIVLLIGFRMYSNMVAYNKTTHAKTKVQAEKKTATPAVKTTHTTTDTPSKSRATANDTKASPSWFNLSKATQIANQGQQASQQMTHRVTKLEQSVNSLEHSLAKTNQALNSLVGIMVKQQQQARQAATLSKTKSPRYHVTAVIPNRAWLLSGDGQTMTVAPGSRIPQLGRVTTIDARQGRVYTDSGTVVTFSAADH